MIDNISRMYELAGATKYRAVSIYNTIVGYGDYDTIEEASKYGDGFKIEKINSKFTDTKQLELIKWLVCNIDHLDIYKNPKDYFLACLFKGGKHKDFSQALAGLVCELWDDLIPEQREEVRGILR